MPGRGTSEFREVLGRLQAAYGRYVAPGDPVEAGAMAILATQAPDLATEASRDRLRGAFTDWNEARVADAWDVTVALEDTGAAGGRKFARAFLRYLESLHGALNRCSFDVPAGEPRPDFVLSLEKARAVPAEARACALACLPETGGWHVSPEMAKAAVKLGLVGRTTSPAKVAQGLAEVCPEEDRLRLHYLLGRYASRAEGEPDPMASASARGKKPRAAAKAAPGAPKAKKKSKGGAK